MSEGLRRLNGGMASDERFTSNDEPHDSAWELFCLEHGLPLQEGKRLSGADLDMQQVRSSLLLDNVSDVSTELAA